MMELDDPDPSSIPSPSSARRHNSDDFAHALDKGFVESDVHSQERGFIPKGELPNILSGAVVQAKLTRLRRQGSRKNFIPGLNLTPKTSHAEPVVDAQTICGDYNSEPPHQQKSYLKIFAILFLIDWPSQVKYFVEEGVCDADLPLVRVKTLGSHLNFARWELRRSGSRDAPLQCFRTGSWVDNITVHVRMMKRFEDTQWQFLAYSFRQDEPGRPQHFEIHEREILPFTLWEQLPRTSGFGEVFKANIHPNHFEFYDPGDGSDPPLLFRQDSVFAVKRLRSTKKEDWHREFKALRLLSSRSRRQENPNHLISLLASYEQRGYYHFIFPHADSNLREYWENHEPGVGAEPTTTALWLAAQCHGLARGLATIHCLASFSPTKPTNGREGEAGSVCCRHGDIKPDNILWFPDPVRGSTYNMGILKITDFGAAELLEKDKKVPNIIAPTSFMYEHPEDRVALRNSDDIWGLGCVFLEFVAWYVGGGWSGVQEFLTRRLKFGNYHFGSMKVGTFFTSGVDANGVRTAVVNPGVHEFIEDLRSNARCTSFLKGFMDIIKEDMLVVEDEAGVGRKSASNVAKRIAELERDVEMTL